ncbi:MAG TPA: PilZ domain-containing protein [Thermodesulfovibrionales bacterium]|jgi:c-di-GMP-binding flagellar brake protein YcgR|nr:PilZ domain-containing protein [Thermodesulfovibrionales bacterium]
MTERRRYTRFRMEVVDLTGKMMFADEVNILDISVGGVSLKADRRLNIGHEYAVKMENVGRVLAVKGLVVWSVLSGNKEGARGDSIPLYTAGMKFMDVSDKKMEEIVNFIEKYEQGAVMPIGPYGTSGLRQSVRVRIDAQGKATVNFPENYKIRILSIGGMLVESERPIEIESRLSMEVFFPENTSITFLGRVASCRLVQDEKVELFHIGIEFIDMSEEHKEKLQEFVLSLNVVEENA